MRALIVDAADLRSADGALHAGSERIDLVYNRLTDFYLDAPGHAALRAAYLRDAVVMTPHPRAHALFANKRNLVRLTDRALLESWQVTPQMIATVLAGVPPAMRVEASDAEQLWAQRAQWFFKPAHGFGSRGTYRGEKITRRVFAEIIAGGYIAQAVVPPSERMSREGADVRTLKVDLRLYVYDGNVQLLAARLYQGQTTNFRTPGGGFAPVFYPAA